MSAQPRRLTRNLHSLRPALLPAICAAVVLLDHFAVQAIRPEEVVRPFVVMVSAVIAVTVVGGRLLRAPEWVSLGTGITLLIFFAYPIPGGVLLALAIWWLTIGWLRRRRTGPPTPLGSPVGPHRAATLFMACLLAVSGWTAVASPLPATPSLPRLPAPSASGGPDIFLLMLDGYPSSESLANEFGFDNAPFERALESSGLAVTSGARSNYNKTWLTMASALSTTYVTEHLDLSRGLGTPGQQSRKLHELINDSPVLDYLRQREYEIVSIPSPVSTSDVTHDARVLNATQLSILETSLLATSVAGRFSPEFIVDLLVREHRAAVARQFDLLAEVSTSPTSRPTLVLAHFMSPHPPFVLEQEPDYLDSCFPTCSFWSTTAAEMRISTAEYAERLAVQVAALNERVTAAVDRIVAAHPEAVVIVMSDHGARHDLQQLDEHFDVFFAARTPSQATVFDGDLSLTNVFRRLLTAYFGEDLPDLEYTAWVSDWYEPLRLDRYR